MSDFYPIMSYDTLLHDDAQTCYVHVFICVTCLDLARLTY